MKLAIVTTALAASAVLFAGCSGGSTNVNPGLGNSGVAPSAHGLPAHMLASGNDSRFLGDGSRLSPRFFSPSIVSDHHRKRPEKEFFITDTSTNVFVFSDSSYAKVGDITSGVTEGDGVWVDKKGNVYVANVISNVVEYRRGAGSPICTYSGMTDPINGTVDSAGNVYVTDYEGGAVREFAQCSNTAKATFSVSSPEGVAVDSTGDVFVAADGGFTEFIGGTPHTLGATIGASAGLAIDRSGNLIADDQEGSIDVIKPPYTTATQLVTGLSDPFHCSLNAAENLLFNANSGSASVTVYSYPSGSLLHTITTSDGIDGAEGVGESPNAVF